MYNSALRNLSQQTVWICNFLLKNIGAKAARQILVRLAFGREKVFSENKKVKHINLMQSTNQDCFPGEKLEYVRCCSFL